MSLIKYKVITIKMGNTPIGRLLLFSSNTIYYKFLMFVFGLVQVLH